MALDTGIDVKQSWLFELSTEIALKIIFHFCLGQMLLDLQHLITLIDEKHLTATLANKLVVMY
jgi:hypothetical protein